VPALIAVGVRPGVLRRDSSAVGDRRAYQRGRVLGSSSRTVAGPRRWAGGADHLQRGIPVPYVVGAIVVAIAFSRCPHRPVLGVGLGAGTVAPSTTDQGGWRRTCRVSWRRWCYVFRSYRPVTERPGPHPSGRDLTRQRAEVRLRGRVLLALTRTRSRSETGSTSSQEVVAQRRGVGRAQEFRGRSSETAARRAYGLEVMAKSAARWTRAGDPAAGLEERSGVTPASARHLRLRNRRRASGQRHPRADHGVGSRQIVRHPTCPVGAL